VQQKIADFFERGVFRQIFNAVTAVYQFAFFAFDIADFLTGNIHASEPGVYDWGAFVVHGSLLEKG